MPKVTGDRSKISLKFKAYDHWSIYFPEKKMTISDLIYKLSSF